MFKLRRKKFEEIVRAGIMSVPKKFLDELDNVAIVIEKEPTPEQRRKLKLRAGSALFGLYEGVPRILRGNSYTFTLPDKITIFQKSVEAVARDAEEAKEIVKDTVWHEIAHHFGMDEKQARRAEFKKRNGGSY